MNFSFEVSKTIPPAVAAAVDHAPRTVEDSVLHAVGTQATVKASPGSARRNLGGRIILANTYHLYLRPGHELVRKLGGLQQFMSWPRAILTIRRLSSFQYPSCAKSTDEGVRFRSHLDGSEHLLTPEKRRNSARAWFRYRHGPR